MAEMTKAQVGIGVFLVRGRKILLSKRKNSHGAGEWSLPGGKVDVGERFDASAVREVFEETGVIIEADKLVKMQFSDNMFPEEGLHFATLYYATNVFKGEPEVKEPHKTEKWEWFDIDHLPEPLFCSMIPIIKGPLSEAIERAEMMRKAFEAW